MIRNEFLSLMFLIPFPDVPETSGILFGRFGMAAGLSVPSPRFAPGFPLQSLTQPAVNRRR